MTRAQSPMLAALSLATVCGFAACSYPEFGFEPAGETPPPRSICTDGELSEAETDIDCGGGCPPCPLDALCDVAEDCLTLSCVEQRCRMPTCEDGAAGAPADKTCKS